MPSRKILKKSLTPELFAQIEEALGDDFDWDTDEDNVPRSRLNKVITQRNDLRKQLKAVQDNHQREDDDDDEDVDDVGGTSTKGKSAGTKDAKKLLADKEAAHAKEIQDLKVQYAALDTLRQAGAKSAQLLWESTLLDKSKVVFDATGKLTGLDEQLATMKKDANTAYLFAGSDVQTGTGKAGGGADSTQLGGLDARLAANLGRFGLSPIDKE